MKTNMRKGPGRGGRRTQPRHPCAGKVADRAMPSKLVLLTTLCSACALVIGDLPPKLQDDAGTTQEMLDAMTPWPDSIDAGPMKDVGGALQDAATVGIPSADGGPLRLDAAAPAIDLPDAADLSPPSCGDAAGRTLFRDRDGDGYGDRASAESFCGSSPGPGWVADGNDCNDANPSVHPGQEAFFGAGYVPPSSTGGVSFDYDCDGDEVAGPDQSLAPTNCVGLLVCLGGGYLPNGARPAAQGVNKYCGSNVVSYCTGSGLLCQDTPSTTEVRYVCN